MKVAQVVSDSNIGGAGKVVLNFIGNCKDIESCVIVPRGSRLVPEVKKLGVTVIEADGIADKSISLRGVKELFKILKAQRPDIVHTHAGLSARIAAKLLGIRIVLTRHWIGKAQRGKLLNNLLCDHAIAVSKDVEKALQQVGIPKKKITVIENAIKLPLEINIEDRARLRQKLGIGNETAVGIVARLEEVKGHKYFLEACSIVSQNTNDVVFLIAGDGSLMEELREYSSKLGLSNVKFLGFVDDVISVFNAVDINVLASREEAFSLSVLEAMSCRVPNVVTRCGGITNDLVENETALFAEYANPQKLAECIMRLINDSKLRALIGANSLKFAKENYSIENMVKKTVEVYTRRNVR